MDLELSSADSERSNTSLVASPKVTAIKRSRHKGELKKGYTTGACATAAALGAFEQLLKGQLASTVSITLPIGETAQFDLNPVSYTSEHASCYVIKDAGDDPDCTHGAHITASVTLSDRPGIDFFAGTGVATVTLPGLELAVGQPAINPVPRKMIKEHLLPLLEQHQVIGVSVTISVPNGEELAKQTIGRRLGLIGGISILGTRGRVNPYSTSAYAASVRQSIEVAKGQGLNKVFLTTGSRTESAAMAMNKEYSELAFVQAGDFSGVGLRASARYGMDRVELVTMIGKLCKLVCGTMMTHVTGRRINFSRLAEIATPFCSQAQVNDILNANTGRHLMQLTPALPQAFWQALCAEAARHCAAYSHHSFIVEVRLVDFDGTSIACATHGEQE